MNSKKPSNTHSVNKEDMEMIGADYQVLKGVYSNIARIQHQEDAFVLDFLNKCFGNTMLASRVIVSPEQVVRFFEALKNNIEKYEEKYGKIKQ